ncbi:MAG TPA: hypothetical protein VJ722_04885 [Rhodanobacteraceae bacterium]|nr:hypothetical protein [Rhodanobacteraceae bacterium]
MADPTAEAPPRAAQADAGMHEDDAAASSGDAGNRTRAGAALLDQLEALYAAGCALTIALKRFFGVFGRLVATEGEVVRHGAPLLFLGTIALIALSVSLWACTVALIFWALRLATQSTGIALGLIVAGHLLLIVGLWISIRRGVRQASFPHARAEVRALGRQLAQDFDDFAGHAPSREDLPP